MNFSVQLITWQRQHGRHNLPWQKTCDPYRIWLSEIMLQQTQVSTVLSYYTRFLKHFPDVAELAVASLDDVMAMWAGLGYYARARNLHRCAQIVLDKHGGSFPASIEALIKLPGIGRSTAAAILVFAFGKRASILDGNVKRVFARVFGIEGFPNNEHIENTMWLLAESLLPKLDASKADIRAYTQGLMDLGAILCVRSKPKCNYCPFSDDCVANMTGRQRQLPSVQPKKIMSVRRIWMLLIIDGDTVMLEKRPLSGIWGGLWSLPEAANEAALANLASGFGARATPSALESLTHIFTHFRLNIEPRVIKMSRSVQTKQMNNVEIVWVPLANIDAYGIPAPVHTLLKKLCSSLLCDVGVCAGELRNVAYSN